VENDRIRLPYTTLPEKEVILLKKRSVNIRQINNRQLKILGAKFTIGLIAMVLLCIFALAQENTTEYWCQKGQELQVNGSYEEAIQAYNMAIQINPENADAWLGKAGISSRIDKHDEAKREYEIALEILNKRLEENSQNASAWINKGVALSCLGRDIEAFEARGKALEIYNQALQKNPNDGNTWENKALVLVGMGRWEDAVEAYDKVIEFSPSKAAYAWIDKAICYSEGLSMTNESIAAWITAAQLIPTSDIKNQSTIWSGIGKSLSTASRYEEAIKAYDKAIELNSKDVSSWPNWSGKAYALYALGRYNESINAFDIALEMMPEFPDIWDWKGNALFQIGRYEEAIKAYDKAIALNPKDGSAWNGKGMVLYNMGRYEEAIEDYDRAIKFAPFNVTPLADLYAKNLSATAWTGKGNALKALGRQSEMEAAYSKAKELGYAG